MADPVAIASVVSSATVAIAVPFISARMERARLRYESDQERFTELRTLLDDAAGRLIEALTVLNRLIVASRPETSEAQACAAIGDRLTQLAIEVFRDDVRLSLRLTEHETVRAHQKAMTLLHTAEAHWRTEQRPPLVSEHGRYGDATQHFISAASRVVAVTTLREHAPLAQWPDESSRPHGEDIAPGRKPSA